MTTANLRREARVQARVPVTVHRGRNTAVLETSDVSFRGLFICTTNAPPLRSLVKLEVAIGQRTFTAHAMIVHVVPPSESRQGGVGLQFWGLSGQDRKAWDDFVRELVQQRRSHAPPPSSEAVPSESDLSRPALPSGVRVVAPNVSASRPPVRSK